MSPRRCGVLLALTSAAVLVAGHSRADLVGWWDFEDSFVDQSLAMLGGAPIGSPSFDLNVPAGIGSAASARFNGNNDGVSVAGSPGLDVPAFTLAYFVNPAGAVQNGTFERLTSRGGDSFETAISGTNALSYFGPAPGWVQTGVTVPGAEWTHVAWRNGGGTMELFVDGVSAWSGSGVGAPTGLMNLGTRHNGSEGFAGLLDDVILWNDSVNPLSNADIANIAQNGVAAFLGLDTDLDDDGMPNAWEEANGLDPDDNGENPNNNGVPGDPDNGATGDPDGDGLANLQEFEGGTDPKEADTDGDTVNDGDEVINGTDPKNPDSDGDGLDDGEEAARGTDPNSADSDSDGFTDGFEVSRGTDPLNSASKPNIDADLALHLTFDDGDLTDQSGHGNDGTLLGGAAFDDNVPESFAGQSLRVNQGGIESDGITVAADDSLNSVDFTLAYWLNPGGAVQNGPAGFERLTSRGSDSFETALSGSNVLSYFGPGGGGGPGWVTTGVTIAAADWTHVAWRNTANPDQIELVVNGESVFAGDGVGAPSGLMNIGIRHNGVEGYEGLMDDVRLYSIALSDKAIADLMEGGPAEDTLKLDINGSGDDLILTWSSRPGLLYRVRSDDDLQPEPAAWPVFGAHEDIEATPPLNTLTVPRPVEDQMFFVVEEYFPPPVSVFRDDFEGGQGDWTTGVDAGAGTVWELGSPSNVGPPAANSGSNVFATNLASEYGLSANVWLRSPAIDLTAAAGATLSLAQFRDIEETFDFGTICVLDASNNSKLAVIEDMVDGDSFDWEQISKSVPEAALGKIIKIEFRFQSDDIQAFAGWYIDNVEVTVP